MMWMQTRYFLLATGKAWNPGRRRRFPSGEETG